MWYIEIEGKLFITFLFKLYTHAIVNAQFSVTQMYGVKIKDVGMAVPKTRCYICHKTNDYGIQQ